MAYLEQQRQVFIHYSYCYARLVLSTLWYTEFLWRMYYKQLHYSMQVRLVVRDKSRVQNSPSCLSPEG